MLVKVKAGQLFLFGVAQVVHLLIGLLLAVEGLDGVRRLPSAPELG